RLIDLFFFFFQAEDGIRDFHVTGVQTCALPISPVVELHTQAIDEAHAFGANGVFGFNGGDDFGGIADGAVDFAAGRVGFDSGVDQGRQGLARLAQAFGDQQPGDHAAVAVGEVSEVVVGAHFAAVDRVFVAHSLLDEGVAGFAFDGFAAGGFDQIQGVPGQAGVVNDFAAAGFSQELVRQQSDDVVAFDEAA